VSAVAQQEGEHKAAEARQRGKSGEAVPRAVQAERRPTRNVSV
jgi:hypothetical protein